MPEEQCNVGPLTTLQQCYDQLQASATTQALMFCLITMSIHTHGVL